MEYFKKNALPAFMAFMLFIIAVELSNMKVRVCDDQGRCAETGHFVAMNAAGTAMENRYVLAVGAMPLDSR